MTDARLSKQDQAAHRQLIAKGRELLKLASTFNNIVTYNDLCKKAQGFYEKARVIQVAANEAQRARLDELVKQQQREEGYRRRVAQAKLAKERLNAEATLGTIFGETIRDFVAKPLFPEFPKFPKFPTKESITTPADAIHTITKASLIPATAPIRRGTSIHEILDTFDKSVAKRLGEVFPFGTKERLDAYLSPTVDVRRTTSNGVRKVIATIPSDQADKVVGELRRLEDRGRYWKGESEFLQNVREAQAKTIKGMATKITLLEDRAASDLKFHAENKRIKAELRKELGVLEEERNHARERARRAEASHRYRRPHPRTADGLLPRPRFNDGLRDGEAISAAKGLASI